MADGARAEPATYMLPTDMRAELAAPWGPVVDTETLAKVLRADDTILAVGDIVSITLQDLGLTPKVFICDYKTQRGDIDPDLQARLGAWGDHELRVTNPAGELHAAAWHAVRSALGNTGMTRIVVDGEEDLLGLPCFLEAPEDAIVIYGMPKQGIVVCTVTKELKEKVQAFIERLA